MHEYVLFKNFCFVQVLFCFLVVIIFESDMMRLSSLCKGVWHNIMIFFLDVKHHASRRQKICNSISRVC